MQLFKSGADRTHSQLAQRVKCFPFSKLSQAERRFVIANFPSSMTVEELCNRCDDTQEHVFAKVGGTTCQLYRICWSYGVIPTEVEFKSRGPERKLWVEFRETNFGKFVILSFTRIHGEADDVAG